MKTYASAYFTPKQAIKVTLNSSKVSGKSSNNNNHMSPYHSININWLLTANDD